MVRRVAIVWIAGVVGCGPTAPVPGDGSTSTSSAESSTSSAPDPASSGTGSTTSGASLDTSEGGPTSSGSTTGGPPPGEGEACDYVMQDCAEGLKCVRIDLDGDFYDERICVAVVDDPLPSGAQCQVDLRTGEDNCSIDTFCAPFFPQDGAGVCTDFCAPIIESMECEDRGKMCLGSADEGHYGCFPRCDPLDPSCLVGHACLPFNGEPPDFACVPLNPSNDGTTGDQCYAPTEGCPSSFCYQCEDGTMCLPPLEYGPGCEGGNELGCCTEYCDLTSGACSNPFHECLPLSGYEKLHPNAVLCGLPDDFDWCDGAVENPPPGQCPPPDAEPNYPWCSPYDTSACLEGNVNLIGGECGLCWCYDSCVSVDECPVPVTGIAEVVCDPSIGCSLLCDQDSDCPNGMDCHFYSGELRCLWRPDGC